MSKDIAFDNETRTKMAAGVNKLADAVRVTIGPKGRYVAMQKEHEKPNVSNDGATVAANVDLEDPIENMGMKIVREAAIAANKRRGRRHHDGDHPFRRYRERGSTLRHLRFRSAGACAAHPARCRRGGRRGSQERRRGYHA